MFDQAPTDPDVRNSPSGSSVHQCVGTRTSAERLAALQTVSDVVDDPGQWQQKDREQLMMHAGSLLNCWLGFAQVGLGSNLTHWVTTTSFLLAPSPRHGLCLARHQPQLVDGSYLAYKEAVI